ncbi:hypothetical protein ANO11243_069780 [Dothideomycetidae sp. 11243]|nr:hypothetical protein ANO11243_069780 [fungal sp. No.11243]
MHIRFDRLSRVPLRPATSSFCTRAASGLITSGDSYTDTGFDVNGQQPTADDPLGNPLYPGHTSSNGPNWIDYLTVQYNASLVQTVNLAVGGATTDPDVVDPYLPIVPSVKQQVFERFLPQYGSKPASYPWASDDTLFAFFTGINDVANSWSKETRPMYDKAFSTYRDLVDAIYQAGGRNFLFLNVPPIQKSPFGVMVASLQRGPYAAAVHDWNERIATLASNLTATYADASATVFDSYDLFNKVIDNPCSNTLTCAYKDTANYCTAYQSGTPAPDTKDPSCEFAADEYLWLNSFHPTFRVHQAMAQAIAGQLMIHGCY